MGSTGDRMAGAGAGLCVWPWVARKDATLTTEAPWREDMGKRWQQNAPEGSESLALFLLFGVLCTLGSVYFCKKRGWDSDGVH